MISLQLLSVFIIFALIYFLWSRRSYYALMLKVPGPKGYPLIGSILDIFPKEDLFARIKKNFDRYGKSFLWWIGPYPFYMLNDPQLVKEVFHSPLCLNKAVYAYDVYREVFGNGIIVSKNPTWSKHRKLLNPAFKHNVLLSFLPIFNNETNNFLKLMDSYVGAGERDLSTDLAQFSLRIARQTTMGNDVDEEPSSKKDSFIHSIEYVLDTLTTMVCAPWLQINLVRQLAGLNDSIKEAKSNIDRTLCKLIDFKLDTNDNSETDCNKPSIFIDHALVHLKNGSLTYQSVIDQSLHILAAAYETSAEAVLFTLILLAMYPEYQEKLFEELYELYPHAGDFDVTYEDIQSLDYLNRVLNESMRLIPPLPLIGRQTSEDFMLSNGVLVPKGTNLFICIVHIHHSKEIWGPDAEIFNPDNFLPENIQAKHQYSFIPFGKGIRGCIGWQYAYISTKTTLIKLLRNYKFSTKFRFEDLVLFTNVTMKLKEVPLLTLEKRNK